MQRDAVSHCSCGNRDVRVQADDDHLDGGGGDEVKGQADVDGAGTDGLVGEEVKALDGHRGLAGRQGDAFDLHVVEEQGVVAEGFKLIEPQRGSGGGGGPIVRAAQVRRAGTDLKDGLLIKKVSAHRHLEVREVARPRVARITDLVGLPDDEV